MWYSDLFKFTDIPVALDRRKNWCVRSLY